MRKKPSAAASLARAVKLKNAQEPRLPVEIGSADVVTLGDSAENGAAQQIKRTRAQKVPPASLPTTGLPKIVRTSKDGAEKVVLHFYEKMQAVQKIDVSKILELPNLGEPLLAGLRLHLHAVAPSSRPTVVCTFWHGFYRFAMRKDRFLRLEDLDDAIFIEYVKWQKSPDAAAKPGTLLGNQSIRQRIGLIRRVFYHLSRIQPWAEEAKRALSEIPRNTQGIDDSRPVEVLPLDQILAIQHAARKEVAEIEERIKAGAAILEAGKRKRLQGSKDFRSADVALAAMVEMYPEDFPKADQANDLPEELFAAVYRQSRGDQRIVNIASLRYASPSDLIPIVILLAIEGGFNSNSLLALQRHQIVPTRILGVPITEINAPKARAKGGVQSKKLDGEIVGPLFELLSELTKRIRAVASEEFSENAFIFKSHFGHGRHAKGFSGSGRLVWHVALEDFRNRNKLPHFNLSNIRATMVDLIGQRHGSIAAHQAAGHTTFDVTEKHYVKSGTRQRDRERLGEVMQYTERFIGTGGAIDVRRSARPAGSDKGSATPGFSCLDPYDSPQPGQRENALCRAYGRCPVCPLATASYEDALAVAYWLALIQAIHAARAHLDAKHWLIEWGPVATELISLIDGVDQATMSEARQMVVVLPPVG